MIPRWAPVAALLVLGCLVAACGSGANTRDPASASASMADPSASIASALITLTDLPRGWAIQSIDDAGDASKPDVFDLCWRDRHFSATNTERSVAFNTVGREGLIDGVRLYASADAAAFVKHVSDAGEACIDWVDVGRNGAANRVHTTKRAIGGVGDEAVAFRITGGPQIGTTDLAVIRRGRAVALLLHFTPSDQAADASPLAPFAAIADRKLQDAAANLN